MPSAVRIKLDSVDDVEAKLDMGGTKKRFDAAPVPTCGAMTCMALRCSLVPKGSYGSRMSFPRSRGGAFDDSRSPKKAAISHTRAKADAMARLAPSLPQYQDPEALD